MARYRDLAARAALQEGRDREGQAGAMEPQDLAWLRTRRREPPAQRATSVPAEPRRAPADPRAIAARPTQAETAPRVAQERADPRTAARERAAARAMPA